MDQFISPTGPERVTLSEVYFHFVALSPSERQATINLVSAIREGHLELRAGKVTEFRPDGNQITYNKVVPEAALADRLGMKFDWELSHAQWRKSKGLPPDTYSMFEEITASRDQVLKLRPVSADKSGKHAGGQPRTYNRETVLIEGVVLIIKEGLPGTLTGKGGLCERVSLILSPESPGDTLLKEILGPLFKRVKAELARK